MAVFKLSEPTPSQVVKDVERVVAVFVVAFLGQWALTNYSLNKTAIYSAVLAGFTAVYGVVKSTVTVL